MSTRSDIADWIERQRSEARLHGQPLSGDWRSLVQNIDTILEALRAPEAVDATSYGRQNLTGPAVDAIENAQDSDDAGAMAWCQPMDCGKHTPRKFMIYFEDPDHGIMVFDNEAEARAAFERKNTAWNCYLFGSLPLSPTAAGIAAPLAETEAEMVAREIANVDAQDAEISASEVTFFAELQRRASPPAASADAVREQIARIIDPDLFRSAEVFRISLSADLQDTDARQSDDYVWHTRYQSVLRKADWIAALSAPVAGADTGMRERAEQSAQTTVASPASCNHDGVNTERLKW